MNGWHVKREISYRVAAGMARALFATALAQALVGGLALTYPNTASAMAIVLLNGSFAALFLGSALLFRIAAPATNPGS